MLSASYAFACLYKAFLLTKGQVNKKRDLCGVESQLKWLLSELLQEENYGSLFRLKEIPDGI